MELRERGKQESQNEPVESLKEKLKAKWNTRDFTPKEDYSDRAGITVFFVMLLSLLTECLVFLVPVVFPDTRWIMSLVTLFMFGETLVNWHRSYFDTANYVKAELKEKYFSKTDDTPQDWMNCLTCQVDSPPRAYHCTRCGKCMLKRVHHCHITGSCIGFYNQKFFVMFCLWSAVSLGFCMYSQLVYLSTDLPINSVEVFTYLPPVTLVKLFLGSISIGQAFIVLHFVSSVICFAIACVFFLWHLFLIYEGLTNYEGWQQIYTYSGTFRENVVTVFGAVWHIPVLVFLPYRFEHSNDGIQWTSRRKKGKGQ